VPGTKKRTATSPRGARPEGRAFGPEIGCAPSTKFGGLMGTIKDLRREVKRAWEHSDNADHRLRTLRRQSKMHIFAKMHKTVKFPLGDHSHILVDGRFPSTQKVAFGNTRELFAWKGLLRSDTLFIDVGANAGVYSIWAADLGAQVIAVEPNDEARSVLEKNAALNGYFFTIISAALFDRSGTMWMTEGRGPQSRLLQSKVDGGIEIEVSTLDDILGDRVANGVKIDVEGAERFVLEGAKKALSQGRIRAIQLEYNICAEKYYGETRDPLRDMLKDYGYDFWQPNKDGVLQGTNPGSGGRRHPDLFAILPE
jgi:FkbM family methyltransferase